MILTILDFEAFKQKEIGIFYFRKIPISKLFFLSSKTKNFLKITSSAEFEFFAFKTERYI